MFLLSREALAAIGASAVAMSGAATLFASPGRTITFNDKVAIKAGRGCRAVKGDRTKVKCTTSRKPTLVTVGLGNRNDKVVNKTSVPMTVFAGSGNDRGSELDGDIPDSGDFLYGGPGNDHVGGDAGNDKIWGNAGNDILAGGPGRDQISGGPGKDQIRQGW